MLDAVQAPAFCRLGRAAALRARGAAAAGFLVGHADDGLARCDGGQPAAAHGVAAGVQQRRTHDGAGNDRLAGTSPKPPKSCEMVRPSTPSSASAPQALRSSLPSA
ncbi:hypothetical protein G6F40_016991 [Rhizopus arrhizus]|nr:hypothetical protein G6F40_016991 [Rhizopus arrhizus]